MSSFKPILADIGSVEVSNALILKSGKALCNFAKFISNHLATTLSIKADWVILLDFSP